MRESFDAGTGTPESIDPNIELLPSVPEPTSETERNSSSIRTNFGSLGYNRSSAVGLESIRQRDAILAQSERDMLGEPYNIKIGRIPLRMAASFDAEYSDNSLRSNGSQSSDLILIPRLDISGSVRLASRLALNIDLGIGYIKYIKNSENDRILPIASLSPNAETGISLSAKIGKFTIRLYDSPGVPQFQLDASTQRQQSQYDQFSNAAGLTVLWDTNSRTSMTFGYSHSNSLSIGSKSNSSNGSADNFLTSLSIKLSDSLGLGLEAGAGVSKYKENLLNGGTTYHIGPTMSLAMSEYLRLQASAGYQGGDYESRGRINDSSSLGSYYANLSLSNSLNTRFNHSISFGHEAKAGAASNFTEVNYVRYQVNWDLIRLVSLGASAFCEDINESGGLLAQHLRYLGFGLHCGFRLTKQITISLGYDFTTRQATGGGAIQGDDPSFEENRILLHLGYAF